MKQHIGILLRKMLATSAIVAASFCAAKAPRNEPYAGARKYFYVSPKEDARYKLDKYEDIVCLFEYSLKYIYEELCLSEGVAHNAYDDQFGDTACVNTVGIGFRHFLENPDDYKNPDAVWLSVLYNPELAMEQNFSHEDILKMLIGWAQYRTLTQNEETGEICTGQTFLKRLFTKLQGVELTPNEFAAVFTTSYCSMTKMDNVCGFVRENYKNPESCAEYIANLGRQKGLKKRFLFSALVYLNRNDFCDDMENMTISDRGTCIYQKSIGEKQPEDTAWGEFSDNCRDKYFESRGKTMKSLEAGMETYFKEPYKRPISPWITIVPKSK